MANNSGLCSNAGSGSTTSGDAANGSQGCAPAPVDTTSISTTTETNPQTGDYYTTSTDSNGNVVQTVQGNRDPKGGPNEWSVTRDESGKIIQSHETTGSDDGNHTTSTDRTYGPDGNITGTMSSTFDRDQNGNSISSSRIFDGQGKMTFQANNHYDASTGKTTSTTTDQDGNVETQEWGGNP